MPDASLMQGLAALGADIAAGRLIPYLGPGVLTLGAGEPPVPASTEALAAALTRRVGVPRRIRQDVWAAAQYIETYKHRLTLDRLLAEVFGPVPEPTPLHRWLAGLPALPLIVDTWYDGALPAALAGRDGWGIVQGVTRRGRNHDVFFTAFNADGRECLAEAAESWPTVVYRPHGGAVPAHNYLISDSDYVEALTEIDIQTPIPEVVQARRAGRGFIFLGCRFNDQMLRTYARQIIKRSAGPHYAVLPGAITRNEQRFLVEQTIARIDLPLAEAVEALTTAPV